MTVAGEKWNELRSLACCSPAPDSGAPDEAQVAWRGGLVSLCVGGESPWPALGIARSVDCSGPRTWSVGAYRHDLLFDGIALRSSPAALTGGKRT
jgi:hypothetical protein